MGACKDWDWQREGNVYGEILVGLRAGFYPSRHQSYLARVVDPDGCGLIELLEQHVEVGFGEVEDKKTMFIWPLSCWVDAGGQEKGALGVDDFLLKLIAAEVVFILGAEFALWVI